MFFLSELYNKTDAEIVAGLRMDLKNFTWYIMVTRQLAAVILIADIRLGRARLSSCS